MTGFNPLTNDAPRVEKGVPLPPPDGRNKLRRYPWAEMEIGDSFFVADRSGPSMARAACVAGTKAKRKFQTAKRQENGVNGVRVWRVA